MDVRGPVDGMSVVGAGRRVETGAARSAAAFAAGMASLALASCAPAREPPRARPVAVCPPGMVRIPAGIYPVGEGDDDRVGGRVADDGFPGIVPLYQAVVSDDFCIDRYPFPGVAGLLWPDDGLNHASTQVLDAALPAFGRRVCTATELLVASTGGENLRQPYGDEHVPHVCDPFDGDEGPPDVLGAYPECVSPFAVHDFAVRSAWAWQDGQFEAAMLARFGPYDYDAGGDEYVVIGGTARLNTFYDPTNFGFHSHFNHDGCPGCGGSDDGLRVCADPAPPYPAREARWGDLVRDADRRGSLLWLAQEAAFRALRSGHHADP